MDVVRNILKKIPWGLSLYCFLGRMYFNYKLENAAHEKIFTELIAWGGKNSISGTGSDLNQTKLIIKELPKLFSNLNILTILDIPCGDFHWMNYVDLGSINYFGADINPKLVYDNRDKYQGENRHFHCMNITIDNLQKVDLIICRDCFVHFSINDIFRSLHNICSSESKYLLTTTFPAVKVNRNIITGFWRPINLKISPFEFPEPIKLINEGCSEGYGTYRDKSLGLWRIEEIKKLLARRGSAKTTRVRVMQVFGFMGMGGVSAWLLDMVRHLDREKFQVDFLVYSNAKGLLDEELRGLGARIFPCPHLWRPLTFIREFIKILRQQGPYDVVHCHSGNLNGFLLRLARKAGVTRRIAHSHMVLSPVQPRPTLYRRAYQHLMRRWILRYMTDGLAASPEAASDLFGANWQTDPRIQVLSCSVDSSPFRVKIPKGEVRGELGIPEDAFVIGHVGRFEMVKNHSFLLDIFAEAARDDPSICLLLIGDGPLRPLIQEKVHRAGLTDRVIFLGFRRDVPRLLLGAMDMFIFPSLSEGLGTAKLEAQTAGLPCIVSDGTPESGDVVKPLITRLSLCEPASVWAKAILSVRAAPLPINPAEALAIMERSLFHNLATVKRLEIIYAGAVGAA
jgi:glycosyltransferase involved in cell wall biosynthesis